MGKIKSSPPPPQPSAGENYESFIKGYAATAPERRQAEFGDLSTQLELAQRYTPSVMALEKELAPAYNQQQIDLERQIGPERFALQEEQRAAEAAMIGRLAPQLQEAVSDPTTEAIRAELGKQVQGELELGATLDPSLRREVSQGVRAGQSARGMTRGEGAVNTEALYRGLRAEQLKRNRQQAATQFLTTQAATRFDPFMAVTGRQSVQQALPYGPQQFMPQNFAGVGQFSGQGMQQQGAINQQNSNNLWNWQQMQSSQQGGSPWGQAISMAGGAAIGGMVGGPPGAMAGGAIGGQVGASF